MKKVSILFVSLLFVFASCSSDDDNTDNQVEVDVTGSWEVTALEGEGEATGEFSGQTVTIPFEMLGKDFDAQMLFTEDPNEIIPTGTLTLEITTIFLGQTNTTEELVDFSTEFVTASSWSIEGNILTYERDGQTQTAEIITLTQNKMVLLTEEIREIMGFEANVSQEVTLER